MKEHSGEVWSRKWHDSQAVFEVKDAALLKEKMGAASYSKYVKDGHLTGYISNVKAFDHPSDGPHEVSAIFTIVPSFSSGNSVVASTQMVDPIYFRWSCGYYVVKDQPEVYAFVNRCHTKKSFKIGLSLDSYYIKVIDKTGKSWTNGTYSILVDPFNLPKNPPKAVIKNGGVLNHHYYVGPDFALFYHHSLIGKIKGNEIYVDTPGLCDDVMLAFESKKVFVADEAKA